MENHLDKAFLEQKFKERDELIDSSRLHQETMQNLTNKIGALEISLRVFRDQLLHLVEDINNILSKR